MFLVDNAFFSATFATGGLALPISCLLAFFTGGAGVFFIQTLVNGDSAKQAFNKALLAGVLIISGVLYTQIRNYCAVR